MKTKKVRSFALVIITILALNGCSSEIKVDPPIEEPTVEEVNLVEYFPQIPNQVYYYRGEGNEYAEFIMHTDYIEGNLIQQRINNGGTEIVRVFNVDDEKIKIIYEKPETYYRENFIGKENIDKIKIEAPLEKGNSWVNSGITYEITETQVNIPTGAGNYTAIEIVAKDGEWTIKEYYSLGVGLIKMVYENPEISISSTLEKIEQGPYSTYIDFFYPNIEDEKYYSKSIPIEFFTNDATGDKIAEAYKDNEIPNTGAVFSEATNINELFLDEDGVVNLDLNQAFISNMNAGASYESMILQSITNTFCKYYGSEKLKLTIDGNYYESGHIAIEKDEYLTPDYTNEIKVE